MISEQTYLLLIILLLFCMHFKDTICLSFEYYVSGTRDPVLDTLHKQLCIVDPRICDIDLYKGSKSYTLNKSSIYICLKDKHGKYYSRNMLCYVLLHEYAHVLCESVGHTPEFYEIFNTLLQKAAKKKLYDPSIPPVENYCGH